MNHIGVPVSDLARSVTWYEDVLGIAPSGVTISATNLRSSRSKTRRCGHRSRWPATTSSWNSSSTTARSRSPSPDATATSG
ncbi:VOC family protein [Micromonospora wenchangensis]